MMERKFGIITLCFILLSGCRELVQDEFERFDRVPVVNSVIVAGEEIRVHVSYTGSIGDTTISVVPDADIALYSNGAFAGSMVYDGDGYYSSGTVAEAGNNYSCEIAILGFDVITCEDSLPVAVTATNIKYDKWVGTDVDGRNYSSVTFTFANDPDVSQYFQVVFSTSDRHGEFDITYPLLDITDPVISSGGIPIAVFSDENIEDDSYDMTLTFYGTKGTPVTMEFRTLSYDYYQYMRKKYLYDLGRYPDDILSVVPGFNLYSNIPRGYGIFAGYSVFVTDSINM